LKSGRAPSSHAQGAEAAMTATWVVMAGICLGLHRAFRRNGRL
jgi:hypothetical protein